MKVCVCEVCNVEFYSKTNRKTCSQKCRYTLANKNTDRKLAYKNAQKTFKQRYGVDNPMKSDEVKTNFKNSMLQTYGVEYAQQSKEIQGKTQKSFIQRFGVDNPMKSDELKDKAKNTMIKRYGVSHALYSKEFLEKSKQTTILRYGVENISKKHMKNLENYNRDYIIENFTTNGVVSLKDRIRFKEYFNIKSDEILKIVSFDIPYEKVKGESVGEKEILMRLTEKYPNLTFKENIRNLIKNPDTEANLELDIVVYKEDEIICAVEYNGVYWHDKTNPIKENLKTHLCFLQGITLFHIWEDNVDEDLKIVFEYLDKIK